MSATLTTDVLVLGLGAFGAAATYQLARRGIDVVGVDRFRPPHEHGSSHGETRITRVGVGEGEAYVALARRSHEIWRALEDETGASLMTTCGALVLCGGDAAGLHHGQPRFVQRSIDVARRFDVPHEVLDADGIAARFPQLGLHGDELGYFEPGGGYLRPEACVAAQLDQAQRLGATLRLGDTVRSIGRDGGGVVVETDEGRIVARRAIACLGPWTASLVGEPFASRLAVYRQTLFWFAADRPADYAPDRFPVYIWMHGPHEDDYFYGFPWADQRGGVKVATEQYGRPSDPDTPREPVGPHEIDAMYQRHVRRHLRGVTGPCVAAMRCHYTVTPDRAFVVDRHPSIDGLTVVSACSGHGFKHSAGMGEALALDALDAPSPYDLAPFRLARFAAAATA